MMSLVATDEDIYTNEEEKAQGNMDEPTEMNQGTRASDCLMVIAMVVLVVVEVSKDIKKKDLSSNGSQR